jgi:hypothetical protein
VTSKPRSVSRKAAARPAIPAPTMVTCGMIVSLNGGLASQDIRIE